MSVYKLGKQPAVALHGIADLATYAAGKLPAPPASVKVPAVASWGMDGNDEYGDCTVAAAAHCIAAWDLEVNATDPVPTSDQAVAEYKALTGCVTAGDARDTGLVEANVLGKWESAGLFGGNRIAGFAKVAPGNILDVHQAIAAYGACYVGVQLPESAEEQFQAGQPWTVVGDQPIGGHAVCFVGYDPSWLYAVTWGSVVPVSWAWWSTYGDEAYAVIPQAFVEAGRGPELDLASLKADIASLNAATKKRHWWEL